MAKVVTDGVWDSSSEPSRLTDTGGSFRVELPPGFYSGRVVVQPGWTQTRPAGGGAQSGTLVSGQVATRVNFGVQQVRASATATALSAATMLPTSGGRNDDEQSLWSERVIV